ncbi:MAG: efflux RND transporter periplasmic adaptor subunit [Candidatus Pacebacteria bacterium]|nr:efflux RND transporter periplasmic adaptor subunit [Candidatus Paceibacterota bacterium]
MTSIFKKHKYIFLFSILAVLVAAGIWFFFLRGGETAFDFAEAKKTDVVLEVSVTGKVEPAQSVDLAFQSSGRIVAVYVDVGDKVFSGQSIASLDTSELSADLRSKEASLESAKIQLAELERGSRPEEIEIQRVKVANAGVALDDAKRTLLDKIEDAYTKSDDAVRGKADQFFDNPRSVSPQLRFSPSDSTTEIAVEFGRRSVEVLLVNWNSWVLSGLSSEELLSKANVAQNNLNQISDFLGKAASVVNSLTPNTSLSQTTIDGWKTDVSAARTNVNTAISNLSTAVEGFRTEQSALDLAEKQLDLELAGSSSEEIEAKKASVKEAEAAVDKIKAQISKNVIWAPIAGVITKQDAKVGETAIANTSVVSMISESDFEIEANIAEADISKLQIGDFTKVTLDAYGESVFFEARLTKIDPAETVIEGVSTYKTTFQFIKKDDRIKSGMTANLDILADKKENVISIPFRAVISSNGDKFVKVIEPDGKTYKEIKVEIGLRGSDGNIEITNGISEGDKVMISVKK